MPINPNGANSNEGIYNFSQSVESAVEGAFIGAGSRLSVKDVLGVSTLERRLGQNIGDVIMIEELINNLDKPILKGLLQDTIAVVSTWFEDPEVLCCLIQGIWAMYAATANNAIIAKLNQGLVLADTDFGKWLDVMIAFVDLIITFISADIRKISIIIPDVIKEIANGVVGAVLLILQEVLFAIRDSAIGEILYQINRAEAATLDMENIWAKCVPFAQLLDLLKKYITDYGLFAELFEKIKGFIAGRVGDFGYMKELDFPKNINDLEFLYWFRDLLVKLKQAAINFDLCVFYGAASVTGAVENQVPTPSGSGSILDPIDNTKKRSNPDQVQGIKVAADGTILRDTNNSDGSPMSKAYIPVISNSSIRTFLNKYYGYPLALVDNILSGSSSADSINGTDINSNVLSTLNADCLNAPTPQEIVRWALRIKNRNL